MANFVGSVDKYKILLKEGNVEEYKILKRFGTNIDGCLLLYVVNTRAVAPLCR
jgi:hypothetical protein